MNNHTSDVEDVIIQGLSNQERRKILKIIKIAKDGAIYSDILAELEVNSGLLNYHLKQLEGLITKNFQGRYFLTPLGEKALRGLYSMTENLEMVMKNISIKPKRDNTIQYFLSFQAFLQLLHLVFHVVMEY